MYVLRGNIYKTLIWLNILLKLWCMWR